MASCPRIICPIASNSQFLATFRFEYSLTCSVVRFPGHNSTPRHISVVLNRKDADTAIWAAALDGPPDQGFRPGHVQEWARKSYSLKWSWLSKKNYLENVIDRFQIWRCVVRCTQYLYIGANCEKIWSPSVSWHLTQVTQLPKIDNLAFIVSIHSSKFITLNE